MLFWAGLLALALPAVAVPVDHIVRDGPFLRMIPRQTASNQLAMKRDWNLDAKNVEELGLKKSAKMLWTADSVPTGQRPVGKEPWAWMTMEKTDYPILNTVNSDYMGDVKCDTKDGWIKMKFNNRTAYDWAWNNWTEKREEWGDYVVVTPESSCKNYTAEERVKWLRATSETKDDDSLTIKCDIKDISFEEAVGEEPVDLEFENFNQNAVSVDANETPGSDDFEDRGGEIMKESSGDNTFDQYLDFKLGKMTRDTFKKSRLSELGLTYDDLLDESDVPDLAGENLEAAAQENALRKRKIGDRIKKAVKKVKKAVQKVAKKVVQVVKEVVEKVEEGIAKLTTVDQGISKDINVDTLKTGGVITTPFKNAEGKGLLGYELLSEQLRVKGQNDTLQGSLEVFCVDCFIQTDLNLRGKIKFIVSRLDVEEAFIELSGSAAAGLGVGLVAELKANRDFKKQIVSIPLTPFSIPNVFVMGPKLDISAGIDLGMAVEGSILGGVRLDWPAIAAKADKNGDNFARGFTPKVTEIFQVSGEIAVTVSLFVEYALGFGLDILNGLFDKSIEIIMKPNIFATAAIGGTFDIDVGGSLSTGEDDDICQGVTLTVGVGMAVEVNVFDTKAGGSLIDELTFDLDSRCFPIGPQDNAKRDSIPTIGPTIAHTRRELATDIGNTTFANGKVAKMFTRDPTKSFRLHYSPNGNTYAVSESKVVESKMEWSGWFVADTTGSLVYGDTHGRVYHGYSDTIEELGVSRLRLHKGKDLPKTAWPMAWTAYVDDETPEEFDSVDSDLPVMAIQDMAGESYFPVTCVYASGKTYSKIFVVKDLERGIDMLKSNGPDVLARVTGQPVETCGYLAITNGEKGVGIDEIIDEDV